MTLDGLPTWRMQVTSVRASYAREMDVRLAALLLAKGAVQDALRAQAAGSEDLPAMQRAIGPAEALLKP